MSYETYPTLPKMGVTDVTVTGSIVNVLTGSAAFPGTAGTTLLPFSAQRMAAIIVNLASNDGFVAFETGSLTTTTGIPISANGGVISFNVAEDPGMVAQSIYGVSKNASGSWLALQAYAA